MKIPEKISAGLKRKLVSILESDSLIMLCYILPGFYIDLGDFMRDRSLAKPKKEKQIKDKHE